MIDPATKESETEVPVLTGEDQARVDHFVSTGVNATDRRPFRPMLLVTLLVSVVSGFSLLSQLLAKTAGVY